MDKFIPNPQVCSPADLRAANLPYILPNILRVQSIVRLPTPTGSILNRATLYHDKAYFSIQWTTRHPDIRIRRGSLVTVVWAARKPVSAESFRVDRLVLVERPRPDVDLFETVPPSMVKDRVLLKCASSLWRNLPREFRHLFNGVFWDGERFLKYVVGPASLEPNDCLPSANFRHCVQVAEEAQALTRSRGKPQAPIAVLAGLLSDAGKAEQFRFDRDDQRVTLSEPGQLISHRHRVQHWIVSALATYRIRLLDAQMNGLLHALTAVAGAPAWLGLTPPRTLEASVLLQAVQHAMGQTRTDSVANQSSFDGRGFRAG